MEPKAQLFNKLINSAHRILITSHISPDPDAVCSILLLGTTLKANFPDKKVEMVLEEKPEIDLAFLTDYEKVQFTNLLSFAKEFQPDLFIMVDAMNYERVSRTDGARLRELISKELKSKLVIIDHHTDIGLEQSGLSINNQAPATVQEVYSLLFKDLGLKKPQGFAQTTLLGIISDTERFLYDNPNHRQTFTIVSELLDAGTSIEELENRLNRYTNATMQILGNLTKNITDSGQGYTYSFVDDDVANIVLEKNADYLKAACGLFIGHFIRNFENNHWGFIVYPEMVNGQKVYSASFRSVSGQKNVAKIAGKLGGGGHEPAAGAKFEADNIDQALGKVKKAIQSSGDSS